MTNLKYLDKKFRSIDQFGEKVTVYYRGHSTYQTKFGSFCTLSLVFIIGAIAIFKAKQLYNKTDPTIVQYSKFYNTTNDNTRYNLAAYSFGMIAGIQTYFYLNQTLVYRDVPDDFFTI